MPEGVVTWSCPRCGRQNSAERELCIHCGAGPAPWPDPLKRCPDCSHEFDESAREGKVHCPKCGRWVGRNMNVGATAYCPKDKEVLVTDGESKVISINIVRDEEGRVASLVGGE